MSRGDFGIPCAVRSGHQSGFQVPKCEPRTVLSQQSVLEQEVEKQQRQNTEACGGNSIQFQCRN